MARAYPETNMQDADLTLFVDEQDAPADPAFTDNEPMLFSQTPPAPAQTLRTLTLKVAGQPKNLRSHLNRIYFCHRHRFQEALFSALLDLFITLAGRGPALGLRLLKGCRNRLSSDQRQTLRQALNDPESIPANHHSLLTSGMIGRPVLIEAIALDPAPDRDCLELARDFIEYSQLDEAMAVLEAGLERRPERQDLQTALAELYRHTQNHERFSRHHRQLERAGVAIAKDWRKLAETAARTQT